MEATELRLRAAHADALKAAIQAGSAPIFAADKELSKSVATRTELELRRATAIGVVEDLRSEERVAELELADAKNGVESAVKDVLKAEAMALADAWQPLDAQARAMRSRLGRHHGPVSGTHDQLANGLGGHLRKPQRSVQSGRDGHRQCMERIRGVAPH